MKYLLGVEELDGDLYGVFVVQLELQGSFFFGRQYAVNMAAKGEE